MNYENMSNLEINRAIAERMGGCGGPTNNDYAPDEVICYDDGPYFHTERDYCGDVSDSWEIIVDCGINIEWPEDELSIGTASAFIEDGIEAGVHFARKAEALRAAMIVYLMMEENNQ